MPQVKTMLLFFFRTDKLFQSGMALYQTFTFHFRKTILHCLTLVKSCIDSGGSRHGIHLLVIAGICHHLLEVSHIQFLLVRHIIDMSHIGIKLSIEAIPGKDDGQYYNSSNNKRFILKRHISQFVEEGFFLVLLHRRYVWQEEKDEEYCTDEQERSKQSQIAHRHRLQRNEGKECSNSSYIAHDKRHYDFLQSLFLVGCMR